MQVAKAITPHVIDPYQDAISLIPDTESPLDTPVVKIENARKFIRAGKVDSVVMGPNPPPWTPQTRMSPQRSSVKITN